MIEILNIEIYFWKKKNLANCSFDSNKKVYKGNWEHTFGDYNKDNNNKNADRFLYNHVVELVKYNIPHIKSNRLGPS